MTLSYNFEAPGTILGVKPYFFANAEGLASNAFGDFMGGIDELRSVTANDRPVRVAALMRSMRQTLNPNLMGYVLANQTHRIDLVIADRSFEMEMWWPETIGNSAKIAEPCCAIFVLRDQSKQIQLRFGYRPSACVVNGGDAQLPIVAAVHVPRRSGIGGKVEAVEITLAGDPEQSNPLLAATSVIKHEKYADNAGLDPLLREAREIVSGRLAADADNTLHLVQLIGGLPFVAAEQVRLNFTARGGR